MISLIVAMTHDNVIGKNGGLPWYIPEDLKLFKKQTENNVVVMGRKTLDSLNMPNGLKNRINIVISSKPKENTDSVIWVNSIESAIDVYHNSYNDKELYIIGGASIYTEALNKGLVDSLYISVIKDKYDGDTYFPNIDYSKWTLRTTINCGSFLYTHYSTG